MDADFQALMDDTLSVSAQVRQYIDGALKAELEEQQHNEQILNRPVGYTSNIDGIPGAIETVQSISQIIVVEFMLTEDVLQFIANELDKHSPIGAGKDRHPGLYKSSNVLLADGVLVEDKTKIPSANEFLFVNSLPYALKIETGESAQAPNGVYELTAILAARQFPTIKIEYTDYSGVFGTTKGTRYPAIRVMI